MALLPEQIIPETEPLGIVSGKDVRITHNWYLLLYNICLQVLGAGPSGSTAQPVTVTASPFSYQAPSSGLLVVAAGALMKLTLTRGAVTRALGVGVETIPLLKNDQVSITYTSAPTVTFFPD